MLYFESDLVIVLVVSCDIFVVVLSYVFGQVLCQIKLLMCFDVWLVWVIKGLEVEIGCLLQDVVCEVLGDDILLVVILGLIFVKELVVGLLMVILLVVMDLQFVEDFQCLLYCGKSFCVYINLDFIGVQFGGVVKNVIVIGVGMLDGIGFGVNVCMVLIICGLVEMFCFGVVLGVDLEIFMGMVGFGDLVFICIDNQFCNCCFGMMFGQGMDVQSVQDKIGQVVEGYCNIKEVCVLVQCLGVEMLIIEEIYQVLYCGKIVCEVVLILLGCVCKDECSSNQFFFVI